MYYKEKTTFTPFPPPFRSLHSYTRNAFHKHTPGAISICPTPLPITALPQKLAKEQRRYRESLASSISNTCFFYLILIYYLQLKCHWQDSHSPSHPSFTPQLFLTGTFISIVFWELSPKSRRASSPPSVYRTVHVRPANFTGTRSPSVFDLQIEGKWQTCLISVGQI